MTSEAPKEVWAYPFTGETRQGKWQASDPTAYVGKCPHYTLTTHARAMVAAERVAICAPLTKDEEWNAALSYRHDLGLLSETEQVALMRDAEWWHNALSHRIRARTPDDTQAALDALLKAERVKGRVEALREALQIADECDSLRTKMAIKAAIEKDADDE